MLERCGRRADRGRRKEAVKRGERERRREKMEWESEGEGEIHGEMRLSVQERAINWRWEVKRGRSWIDKLVKRVHREMQNWM